MELAEAKGYLVYDQKKCTGCKSCMIACSMAHEGKSGLSSSRLQILEDRFGCYPGDITIAVCKQCKDPSCLTVCPVDAIYFDEEYMNIRRIDEQKCIGCRSCIEACHFEPSRMAWNHEKQVALKCDLCKDTPYWEHEKGKLVCVEVCPVNALMFTEESPIGYKGYEVNLRGHGWKKLDLPVD